MHQSETRILTNNTQTCINLEERQKAFSEIEYVAEAYFAGTVSPMTIRFGNLLLHASYLGIAIGCMVLFSPSVVFVLILSLTMVVNLSLFVREVGMIIKRARSGIISWRDVLMNLFADYQPSIRGDYYRLVASILDDGLQRDRFNVWLAVEREALNAREKDLMKGKHFSDKDEKIVKALRRRLEEG